MEPEYVDISLSNPLNALFPALQLRARKDNHAVQMRIPAEIALQLGLQIIEKRGGISYVGTQVHCGSRIFFTGALVTGKEIVVGRLAMAEMENVVAKRVA